MKKSLKYTTTSGRQRVWSIEAAPGETPLEALLITTYGDEGGKMQSSAKKVKGKNKGKANETTALEQAISEAESKYKLKAQQAGRAPYLPMLAKTFAGAASIKFPCYVQPKLDGIRAVFTPGAVGGQFISREGNIFHNLDHLSDVLNEASGGAILDGELYSRELNFEDLKGLISRTAPPPEVLKIRFFVFDIVDEKAPFAERLEILLSLKEKIDVVPTYECNDLSAAESYLDQFTKEGYEGLMLRTPRGAYAAGKRSADLQKLKKFKDEEFEIIGFKREVNSQGIVWQCKTAAGWHFWVKPKGEMAERAVPDDIASLQIGKFLTVKYQEMTHRGVPRFPVGITIRDYE